MKIGFTGTRKGLTQYQKYKVDAFLKSCKIKAAYHGGCHGADTDFHTIVSKICLHIYVLPGDAKQRENFIRKGDSFVLKPKPYLERNKDIVNNCNLLIVCPNSTKERLRSGTWATYRYAKKIGKPVVIFYPKEVTK